MEPMAQGYPEHPGPEAAREPAPETGARRSRAELRLLHAVQDLGTELTERDGELRDVLARFGDLYRRMADDVASLAERRRPIETEGLELQLRALVQSVDTLVGIDTVASERVANLSATVERLAESTSRMERRLAALEERLDEAS